MGTAEERGYCPAVHEVREWVYRNPLCPLSPEAQRTLERLGCTWQIEVILFGY